MRGFILDKKATIADTRVIMDEFDVREEKWATAVLWILSIMILGNFITCLYATIALFKSQDDIKHFWLGKYFRTL